MNLVPPAGEAAADEAIGTDPLTSRQIPLFRDVEPERLKAAIRRCERLDVPAGGVLLQPGQVNDAIFVILTGQVSVHLDREGSRSGRGIAIPIGQCIGEFSAIDGQPASALVRAEEDATVLRIPQQVFWSDLVPLPGVARNMMVSLVERTRLTNQLALEAQREAMELTQLRKELELARTLQAGMLPPQGRLFPERTDIEIASLMEPASSVAGDFFDAFFVAEDRLFVCVGDVSGHGIGAALFMARTIGQLRILANGLAGPDQVLRHLNDSLIQNNEAALFVTLFCGVLDLASGLFTCANGGHCPPLLLHRGEVGPLPVPRGALLGAFPERRYRPLSLQLDPGDLVLLFTDGVTEAESATGTPFGVEGCRQLLLEAGPAPLALLTGRLRQQLRGFTGSHQLEDDCTLLLLRRPPG